MPLNDKEKLNRLEDIKTKLFSKNWKPRVERHDGFSYRQKDVPDSWQKEGDGPNLPEKFFLQSSVFRKFFIFSAIFFVLALGFAFYAFFGGGNTVSNANIDISILGSTFTAGGEELPLQIEIVNRNNSALELADLVIEYPKGTTDVANNLERLRQSLGTIPAGSIRTENLKIVLFGEQDSVQPVKISLEYRVENSNAIFVKEKDFSVSISSAPINLAIEAPTEASSNQDVNLKIRTTLNATKPASKIMLQVDYPTGFQFEQASPAPTFGNNVWSLGDLAPGAEREISIIGKMVDVFDGEEKTFHIWSGSQSGKDKTAIGVIFNSLAQTITIKKPFIAAQLFINGVYQREYASDAKTSIQGQINWANNLPTKINDLQIKAKISGNAVNRNTINSREGFYDSSINTIVWDKNYNSQLAEINPGDSGSVSFSLSAISLFLDSGGMLANPAINIDVSISGRQALEGNAFQELANSESKIIRIISDVGLSAKALYYSGAFANTGPIPPKAEQETTYTIVWSLSNSANNISKAQIKSSLPPWIKFVGPVSPPSEDLTYNSSAKEIVWNIGSIPRGTGITEEDREVSFQVAFQPSLSQVGTAPAIVNDAILTGYDDFAKVDVRVNKASLNTRLSNDSAFVSGSERVVE